MAEELLTPPNPQGGEGPSQDELIKSHLKEMLQTVDLETTTEKQLRKRLEEKLGCDLTEKKGLIRGEVEAFLAEQQPAEEEQAEAAEEDEEEEDEEEKAAPKSRKRKSGSGPVFSPAMQAFLDGEGVEITSGNPRPAIVKALWVYIKAHNLQNPKNKKEIICDDKLKTIFKPPINMFSMNKQIGRHVGSSSEVVPRNDDDDEEDEASDGDDDDDDDGERKPRRAAAPKPKKAKKERDPNKPPATGGFMTPVRLSPALSDFLGVSGPITRSEIVKQFHAYFKANALHDPSDKRNIICDKRLKELLGVDKFLAFGVTKHLKEHILKGK